MVTPRKSRKGTPSVKKARATAMDQSSTPPTYDDVARRAYELYLQRGCYILFFPELFVEPNPSK